MESFTASRNAAFSESTETVVYNQPVPKQWYTFGCFPSRWAFLVLAVLLTMMSLTSLVMGSVLYSKLYLGITEFQRIGIILHVVVYALLLIFCGFGLYSVIFRSSRVGSWFCVMLLSQILFEIVAGAICLHFLFNEPPNNDFVGERARCLITAEASPKDLFLRELCLRTPIARVVCLLLFLLIWIIQMFTLHAANMYVGELQEEQYISEITGRGKDVEENVGVAWR
ncbi:hypothetical protein FA13DRAFT_1733317 [Coprinellus micaceus]|uniref:Tetraspannin-domain-containing protein n=1 Tax=Coprinellus micaceus TaxID=71717 RepID=A0A4Y7TAD9_COPMI|nr:hypothetical protein FA13DRAFT_1733317 [Coprinellus micaceus]